MYRVYSGCYKATLEPRRKRRLGEHSHYGGEKPTFLTLPTSRLKTLTHLVERAKTTKLTKSERQTLDIFVVAFVTMSRVGEIAALHVDEVGRRGETVAEGHEEGLEHWGLGGQRNTEGPQRSCKKERKRVDVYREGR